MVFVHCSWKYYFRCSNYCQGRNSSYIYFGLSRRHECRCGNTVPGNNHLIADSECNEICPGNKNETCGTHRKTQVYQIIGELPRNIIHTPLQPHFLPAAKPAGQWMMIHLLVSFGSGKAFRNHRSMVTYVIEATESDSEVVCDLGGH